MFAHPHFVYWIFPLLCFNGLMIFLAGFAFWKGYHGTCRVLLSVMGLFWCTSALLVESLLHIWYPDFSHDSPPDMVSDPRAGHYIPFCDLSASIKCSTGLMSPHNRFLNYFGLGGPEGILDFANASLGIPFFIGHIIVVICATIQSQENQRRPRYYHHSSYYDEQGCDCISFHSAMVILTGITSFLTAFHCYWQFFYLREISVIYCCSYVINLALVPVSLTTVKAPEPKDGKKQQ